MDPLTLNNSTFNFYNQSVVIYSPDGTPITINLHDIDFQNYYNNAACINFGTQFGACVVMFAVVLVLTAHSKRTKAIFILNEAALFLGAIRALLLALFFVSEWVTTYAFFTGDYSQLPRRAYATSIATTLIAALFTLVVDLSLVLQARVVAASMTNLQRLIITSIGCTLLFVSVGFRFTLMVINNITILNNEDFNHFYWLTKCDLISQTVTIWYFSLIFTGKLVYTLYTRRRNGWKQWSGMRILAAMGGCTMIIPSVFAVLQYLQQNAFPEGGTVAMTFVALLLPLSSLWAGMSINAESAMLNKASLVPMSDGSSVDFQKTAASDMSQTTTMSYLSKQRETSVRVTSGSPWSVDSGKAEGQSERGSGGRRDSTERDLEAMGVRVQRSYSIHSGREEM